MSRNEHSSSGLAEDLIRSYIQMGCAELHAKTLYEKATAELDNGIVDVSDMDLVQAHIAKIDGYREDISTYADLRRRMMLSLYNMFEDGDKEMWCQVKHLGLAMMTAFESYQASDDDPELMMLAYDANRAFTKAMTRFLGVEISDCAACFSDALKAEAEEVEDGKEEGKL